MTAEERAVKALEAARDVIKQLVTADAALLTFGIGFVKDIAKSQGPTGLIDWAAAALLVSIVTGVAALILIVAQTHKANGSINAGLLRWSLFLSLVTFGAAVVFIGIYVMCAPTPLPKAD